MHTLTVFSIKVLNVLVVVYSATLIPANTPDKTTRMMNTPTNVLTWPSLSLTIYLSPPTTDPLVSVAAGGEKDPVIN